MKHTALSLAVASALLGMGTASAEPVTTENTDIIVNTQGGVEVKTVDKKFGFKLGGRVQFDQNVYDDVFNFSTPDASEAGDWADNNFFRRVRIELTGNVFYDWFYELTPNFGDNDTVNIEYAWFGYTERLFEIPSMTRVGKFKPYFGLDELTSSKWITAIERSAPTQFFVTGTRNGFGSEWTFLDQFTVGATYFRDPNSNALVFSGDGGDLHGYSARGVWSPIHEEGLVAHLGVSYLMRETQASNVSARQEVRAADQLRLFNLDGGNQFVQRDAFGFEALGIMGPFSLEGEYYLGWLDPDVDQLGEDEIDVDGFYVTGRWTITGESLPYDLKKGIPGQIKPAGGWGAWELFARYSNLSLDVANFDTSMDTITAGVNWYVNKNIKLAVNYIHTELDGDLLGLSQYQGAAPVFTEDSGDALATRAQFAF